MTESTPSQVQPVAGALIRSRAWTFEKTSAGPWPGSLEPQLDRYWAARRRPTCRNRGPAGRGIGDGSWRKTYSVVLPSLTVQPGTVLPDGLVVPATGAVLHDVPLAPAVRSAGQVKKLLRQVRTRFPEACVYEVFSAPGRSHGDAPGVSAPGAPQGWHGVRAPALAPRLTWAGFAAAAVP